MRQALAQVIFATESERGDATEQHLYPCHDGQAFAKNAMNDNKKAPQTSKESRPLKVQFEVGAQDNLGEEGKVDEWSKRGMDVMGELAALMFVAEEVTNYGKKGA